MADADRHDEEVLDPDPEPEMTTARSLMIERVKQMSIEERIALFERLSRDAAWARSAKRVR